MGLMVIQDMPSLRPDAQPTPEEQEEFQRLLEIMIEEHKSYPSVVAWVRPLRKSHQTEANRNIGDLQRGLGSIGPGTMARRETN
jgi:hypothetical protein